MEFQNLGFVLLPIFALIFWSIDFWKLIKRPQLALPKALKNNNRSLSRFIAFVIGVAGWLVLALSASGPRKPLKVLPSNIEVNDILLVVDVSRSMLADDLQPNRLEVAKEKLRDFARLRPTDRIGVIIFSEKVFTMLPLTTDPSLIDKIISEIKVGYLGSGTNIGDALGLAVGRAHESPTKNKVIVLLTDGVSNVGNTTPLESAQMAKDFNIKVYTIGLGGSDSAQIPLGNGVNSKFMQNIPGGSIDMKTLQTISTMTGGKSYLAHNENSLKEILNDIQKLEKTEIKSSNQVVYEELYLRYLLIGLLLLMGSEMFRKFVLREVM